MAAPGAVAFTVRSVASALARSFIGPTRTRYSVPAPDFTGITIASRPWPRNSFTNRSAVASLEKLPSCTAQLPDVWTDGGESSTFGGGAADCAVGAGAECV